VELALHVPVIGDSVAPFMAGPDTDATAIRAADSLAFLPSDPAARREEILRRREEIGFFVLSGSEQTSPVSSLRSWPNWPDGSHPLSAYGSMQSQVRQMCRRSEDAKHSGHYDGGRARRLISANSR